MPADGHLEEAPSGGEVVCRCFSIAGAARGSNQTLTLPPNDRAPCAHAQLHMGPINVNVKSVI